jgi:hypothetical protein
MSKRRSKRHSDDIQRGSRTHHHRCLPREGCPTPTKLCFEDEEHAIKVLRYMSHDGRTRKPCRIYRCECGYFHTSSRSEWVDY